MTRPANAERRSPVVDVASSLVGVVLGVTVGGILTLYGVRVAIDWAITRAVQAG